jgi:hypothetical protein
MDCKNSSNGLRQDIWSGPTNLLRCLHGFQICLLSLDVCGRTPNFQQNLSAMQADSSLRSSSRPHSSPWIWLCFSLGISVFFLECCIHICPNWFDSVLHKLVNAEIVRVDTGINFSGFATNQASGIDSCLAPTPLTRIASASAESRRQTASHQESGEPQNNAVSLGEARVPKHCTLDSWHESQITPLVVRCIGRLPDLLRVRRDAAFSCISDCGEAGVRSSSKCRKN